MLNNSENKGNMFKKASVFMIAAVVMLGVAAIVKPGHQSPQGSTNIVKPGHGR